MFRMLSVAAGVLTVCGLQLAAVAAAPSTAWVTAPGGTSSTAVATVQGTATTSSVTFKDLSTNFVWSCPSSSWQAATATGANKPVTGLMQFSSEIFGAGSANPCKVAGIPIISTGLGTWAMAATSASSPLPAQAGTPAYPVSNQTTPVRITAVKVSVSSASCNFDISGFVNGSYTNANPSYLTLPASTAATSGLVTSNVTLKGGATTCLAGGVSTASGDKISLAGTYTVSATQAAQKPIWLNAR